MKPIPVMQRPADDDRSHWLLIVASVATVAYAAFAFALYMTTPAFVPPSPPFLARTIRGARIIAEAIATPPTPIPGWIGFLYFWQPLTSAVFALDAALVGAWALMRQTEENRRSARDQIAASELAAVDRRAQEVEDAERAKKDEVERAAGAIAAELRSWINRLASAGYHASFDAQLKTIIDKELPPTMPVIPIFVDAFPVYEALCHKLGLFDPRTAVTIVESYAYLRGALDAFKGIRAGDYGFLMVMDDGSPSEAAAKAKVKAMRAKTGIESIIGDLAIFDTAARSAVKALQLLSGRAMPNIRK